MLLLFIVGLVWLQKPEVSGELKGWDIDANPEFELIKKKDSVFGTGKKIYLIIQPKIDSLFQVLQEVDQLQNALTEEYEDAMVVSPSVFYSKMIRNWLTRDNDLKSFLAEGKEVPLLKQLIANDLSSFLMVFSKSDFKDLNTTDFNNILERYDETIKVQALSEVHLADDISASMRTDMKYLVGLICSFFILYMMLMFRSVKAIVYTLLLIVLSIVSTVLLFSLLGLTINVVSILAIPIVLILALSDALHLLSGYDKYKVIIDKEERVTSTLKTFVIPSFFSSLTTAIAFFSFYLFSESQFIQEFGLVTSIALMVEFIIAYLISPLLLYWININSIRTTGANSLASILQRYRLSITIVLGVLTIVSIFLVKNIEIESSMDSLFPRNSTSEKLNEELKKNYFNVLEASLIVTPNSDADTKANLHEISTITEKCKRLHGVVNVNSSVDSYMFKGKLGRQIDLFKVLGDRSPYYNLETNQYLIDCQFKEDKDILKFAEFWRKNKYSKFKVEVVSNKLMMDRSNYMVSTTLIESLSTAGLGIFLVILFLTRSIKASILSMLPNLIPLGIVVLIYSLFDLQLNMITSLTMVISLGLLDDDTVHILYRKLWLKKPMEELNFSVLSSGILLSFTFIFFGISKFFPVQQFGVVTAIIFLIGVLCEMTLMVWILEYVAKTMYSNKHNIIRKK